MFQSPVTTPVSRAAVKVREDAGEGAEIVFRPAFNIICITRSLPFRFVDEIGLV
jgi:hypothetical protein